MKDLANKTEKELKEMLAEKQKALRVFRFSIAGSNARNVKEGVIIRKTIARIKTKLSAMKA